MPSFANSKVNSISLLFFENADSGLLLRRIGSSLAAEFRTGLCSSILSC